MAKEQAEREAQARKEQEAKAKQEQVKKETAGQVGLNRPNKDSQSVTRPATVANYTSVATATVEATQAVLNRRQTPSYQAGLPETGDQNVAVYSLVGMGLLGLAGVAGRKRRG